MKNLLTGINSPEDVKKLDTKQLNVLAAEIREFLVENVSNTGGHLASNLGVVELTLALHRVFTTPRDKIVWDVGHQSYVHKMITGRKEQFGTLRQLGGISGFPKTNESVHDAFNTGHSSTSISAALGIAKARDIKRDNYSVIAVIGDGALTGGMSFEALNHAGMAPNNLIVILNDNGMSIAKNVGSLSKYLGKIRMRPYYYKVKEDLDFLLKRIPGIGKGVLKVLSKVKVSLKYLVMSGLIFEELGFKYIGPIDGHDVSELMDVMEKAKALKGPVLLHVCTQKGKGYTYAEENPHLFHGISPFEIETGELKVCSEPTYSDVFGSELIRLAENDGTVAAITAAMPHGTGLEPFSKKFPERFFDVGIAEQHAVTFAAGLARNGIKPVVAIYSSFFQRAYDQILHDVVLQNLHVVLAIDRAGIVGEDGETHQGIYDLSYLYPMPNISIMAPCDYSELAAMLKYAVMKHDGPIAIRYPRGKGSDRLVTTEPIRYGKGVCLRAGSDVTLLAAGNMVETALKVSEKLQQFKVSAEVINVRFVKPLDEKLIITSAVKTGRVVTLEDNTASGGLGDSVLHLFNQAGVKPKTRICGFPDEPVTQGTRSNLYKKYRLDVDSLVQDIMKFIK